VVALGAGLKAKEQHMRELVSLAEHREAACKSEIGQLLASRSAMFESSKAAAAVAAAAAAAAAEAAAAAAAGPRSADEDMDAVNARIEAAEKRMDAAQVRLACDVRQPPNFPFERLFSTLLQTPNALLELAAFELHPLHCSRALLTLHMFHAQTTGAVQQAAQHLHGSRARPALPAAPPQTGSRGGVAGGCERIPVTAHWSPITHSISAAWRYSARSADAVSWRQQQHG
jgi:hypothetical protein